MQSHPASCCLEPNTFCQPLVLNLCELCYFLTVQLPHSYEVTSKIRRDFRLPQRCRWDLPSSGILRSLEWYFRTDVLEQPICPILKGQEVP
jgi:hypothetical protein